MATDGNRCQFGVWRRNRTLHAACDASTGIARASAANLAVFLINHVFFSFKGVILNYFNTVDHMINMCE